ncbi:FecCD family ABC transporter permease [Streptomyces rhizosphaericola]|uniref:FecCD family ABC transporter permease n=1 Tax=Streptomyces TaxID=1883 RepID=UPI0003826273|nr:MULTISPECIES: iron chelate uptake ABC transporter family permease subunit [unclassified Streptomyces]MYT35470.1 iron chelate uptake ABC transporter family permease subunit [Streptomyces sp. SID8356]MYT91267.1 iron chelate uptake ABC transporter family permease subunit [Streptomyces sp. SID8359]PWS41915.1 iron ABC transporter permease [Streptomyces sp. ZEA17I]
MSGSTLTAAQRRPQKKEARPRRSRPVLALGLLASLGVLLLAVVASLAIGSGDVPFRDVLPGVFDPDLTVKGQLVIQEVRIPRTVAGLLAGAALGLAGTVMQGVARNPLADPQLLGINAGASVAVVCSITLLGFTVATQFIWFGFLGALLAALLVYGVGSLGREGATPVKLALAGAATAAVLTSITSAILLQDRGSYDQFRFWQLGALTARSSEVLWQVSPFILAGTVLAFSLGPQLNALSLGDDLARGLGQRVGRARMVSALAVVILCGAATVVAGPIGFVGLAVPHAARLITGPDYRWVLPYSMVLAPIMLLVADIIGRVIAPPGEVQVGVITAAVGCIPFIWLVRRRKLVEL